MKRITLAPKAFSRSLDGICGIYALIHPTTQQTVYIGQSANVGVK